MRITQRRMSQKPNWVALVAALGAMSFAMGGCPEGSGQVPTLDAISFDTVGGDQGGETSPTDVSPTDVPPSDAPPTDVPPSDVPPTDVLPSDAPPTDAPPSDVPPSDVPPSDVPPSDVPPTDVPPTDVPPSDVPPTDVPPTDVPPSDVPPTDVPPTDVPPTDVPVTDIPNDTPGPDAEVVAGACTAEFDACDPAQPAGTGFVCVAVGNGNGVCRIACDITADDCGAQVCIAPGTDTAGFCAPTTCSSYFLNSDECGAGAGCVVLDGAGECYVAGPTPDGGACDFLSDCVVGTICLAGQCVVPECSADGVTKPCTQAGENCEPFNLGGVAVDIGSCLAGCVPFVDTCDAGETCVATQVSETTGELEGLCVDSGGGTVGLNGDCTEAVCQDGLICLDLEGQGVGTCVAQCWSGADSGEPGGCGADTCFPLVAGGEPTLLGFCGEGGCTPFMSPSSCPNGQWCTPNTIDATVGTCEDVAGTVPEGGACGDLPACCEPTGTAGCAADAAIQACVCAIDSYCCDTDWDQVCADLVESESCGSCTSANGCSADLFCIGGECQPVCDVGSTTGDLGGCEVGQDCAALQGASGALDLGVCIESCAFHAPSAPCADAAQVCVPGDAFNNGVDFCLDVPAWWPTAAGVNVGDTCPAGGEPGSLCRADAACLDVTGGGTLACVELCHTSEGPFGSSHPDCDGGGPTTCQDAYGEPAFGLCL